MKNYHWLINFPLIIGPIFGVYIGGITNNVILGCLITALISSIIILLDIYSTRWQNWQHKNINKISNFSFIISIFFCVYFNKLNYFIEPFDKRLFPIVLFLVGFLIFYFLINKNLKNISIGLESSISLLFFYSLSIGHTFAGYYLSEFATYTTMFLAGIFTCIFCETNRKNLNFANKKGIIKFINLLAIFLVSLSFLAIFRKDFLDWSGSSAFHWFYFVGPVSEYQAGGGIETFNQYSQGALMVASKLSKSAWNSVYLFQIIIYSLTLVGLTIVSIGKKTFSRILIACLCFFLMFADPWSVGPQAYPSAGLLRFFPLIAWSSFIYSDSLDIKGSKLLNRFRELLKKLSLFIAIIASFFWSAEMALCSLAAIFIVLTHTKILEILRFNFPLKVNKVFNIFKNNKIFSLILIFLVFIFLVIYKTNISILSDNFIGQLISYPINYLKKGHGWYEPQAWITLYPLFLLVSICSLVLVSNLNILKKIGFLASCGLVFGYVSYRPVSNNITAAMPSILILVSSFIASNFNINLENVNNTNINFKKFGIFFRSLIIGLVGTSAMLQLFHFKHVAKIISISTGKSRGYYYFENGGMNVLDTPDCKKGDQIIEDLIKDQNLLRNIREKNTGITYVGVKYNYLYELGTCYEHENAQYHPFIFQPIQLYNAPLDENTSRIGIVKALKKRKFERLIFLSDIEDQREDALRDYFFTLLPNNWDLINTYEINNRFKGFIWEKKN